MCGPLGESRDGGSELQEGEAGAGLRGVLQTRRGLRALSSCCGERRGDPGMAAKQRVREAPRAAAAITEEAW